MNAAGAGQWQAFSAGSTPTGTVHPMALATLKELGLPTPVIGRNPGTNLRATSAGNGSNRDGLRQCRR